MALRLLVVDDETGILRLIKSMVTPLGFEVQTTASGLDAAERIEKEKYDGLLIDVKMPGMDGFELTRRVRSSKLNRYVPIVILTGLNDADTMRRAFEAGAMWFLTKPVSADRLHGLMKALRGSMLQEKRKHARLPLRTTVRCAIDEHRFRSSSLNICEGGLLIQPSGGLSMGQEIDLEFSIPTANKPVKLKGKVVRQETPDIVGLAFTNATVEVRQAIQTYISGGVKD